MEKKAYFYGNLVSDYGVQYGFVDYACFCKAFDAVLNNDIISTTSKKGFVWECVNGYDYDEETDEYRDVYQWYIVDGSSTTFDLLNEAHEIIYYCEELDLYMWGVTHYGTSWTHVLTSIPINKKSW